MESHRSFDTIVVGAGQAGLSVGYHLQRNGGSFLIVDANDRIGAAWRSRWDSLRLFTPAKFCGLDGLPFPAPPDHFPTKDEMADYLELYAATFALPVRLGFEVDRLSRDGGEFMIASGDVVLRAKNVIVAMGTDQRGVVPGFADDLRPEIRQLHSSEYVRQHQLADGDVLVVGAGNSGVEIALDISKSRDGASEGRAGIGRTVWISGRHTGNVPFDIESFIARKLLIRLVLRGLYHRVLSITTPIGRKVRPKILKSGTPLIRSKPRDLKRAGIERVARVAGVRDGWPVLDDGRVMKVANVIWATGFNPGFDWIDIDVHGQHEPRHREGIVDDVPGLYFVGLEFLRALSSGMIHGVGQDAERIAGLVDRRRRAAATPDLVAA